MADLKKILSSIFRAKEWKPEEMQYEPFAADMDLEIQLCEQTAYYFEAVPAGYKQYELVETISCEEKAFRQKMKLFWDFYHEVYRTFVVLNCITSRKFDIWRTDAYWAWKRPQYAKEEDAPPARPFPEFFYNKIKDVRPEGALWFDEQRRCL